MTQEERQVRAENPAGAAGQNRRRRPVPDRGSNINLRVHIERLSLDGFELDGIGERAVRRSLQQELSRLLSNTLPDRVQRGGAVRDLGGSLAIASWADPEDLGRQIAGALYQGLSVNERLTRRKGA